MDFKYIVVGAGFFGAVIAERIAAVLNERVLVVERRNHPGGNSYSFIDKDTGIECHKYGSHIFHTTDHEVWDYINRFDSFTSYQHKVFTIAQNRVYTMPFNLKLLNDFFGCNLSPWEAESFLMGKRKKLNHPAENFEEQALSLMGKELYETFFKGYTEKQWGKSVTELPSSILKRLPVRYNYNNNYFEMDLQGVPLHGYGRLFEKILDHPNIVLQLNTDYLDIRKQIPAHAYIIYTGALDRLFDFQFGQLEWRSLNFEWETREVQDFQGTTVINYADKEIPYTRIHEFKHYHPERKDIFLQNKTVICREYPVAWKPGMMAYYPVEDEKNKQLQQQYLQLVEQNNYLEVGGRLGNYRYWDMDMTIRHALNLFSKIKEKTSSDETRKRCYI